MNSSNKQPVLFIGHGSPMNAIEDNAFSRQWRQLGQSLSRPRLILVVSAHWYLPASCITAMPQPQTIYDMYGFPPELYQVSYPAPGSPDDARQIQQAITEPKIGLDQDWGLDHGTWSVLVHLFPQADIPVLQLSIDRRQTGEWHLRLGQQLQSLREQGVLIVGSGNLVHNLRAVNFQHPGGFDWAESFQSEAQELVRQRNDQKLARFEDLGRAAQLSIPTPEHFLPLLYVLGASQPQESQYWFNQSCSLGSLSMASVLIGGSD